MRAIKYTKGGNSESGCKWGWGNVKKVEKLGGIKGGAAAGAAQVQGWLYTVN